MNPLARPVYLDLIHLRLPLPGWVSILHRVSGLLLFLALPLGVGALSVSLSDEAGFRSIVDCATHPLAKVLVIGLAWSFAHHFFAGLRHLAMDAHWGADLKHARRSSVAVFVATALTTLACAAWVFA